MGATQPNRPLYSAQTQVFSPRVLQQVEQSQCAFVANGEVHFMPVKEYQRNYNQYCRGWLTNDSQPKDLVAVIRRYTSELGGWCYKVNAALAADLEDLKPSIYGTYVRELKFAMGKLCKTQAYKVGHVKRGVDLSPHELARMKSLGDFYIPSFTSTSDNGGEFDKSHVLDIDATNAPYALKMTPAMSPTHILSESEVLLGCYTRFRLLQHTGSTIYLKVV